MTKLTNVPSSVTDPQLRLFLQQVRDGFGTIVTRSDFEAVRSSLGQVIDQVGNIDDGLDYTPPIALTNLVARSMFEAVALSWDSVFFGPGFLRGVGRVEVWRAIINDRDTAVLIQSVTTDIAIDYIEPNASYYYWIRAVSTGGVPGPFNTARFFGTLGKAVIPPEDILDSLEGEIRESHLFTGLNARINLIDAPTTGLVAKTDAHGNTLVQHGTSIAGLQFDVTPLRAQWTLKTQVNDLVGGVGFYNDGVKTQFLVAANTFAVYSPGSTSLSFVVDSGRVVMDAAFIKDATITDAKISDLTVNKVTGITSNFLLSTIGIGNITDAYIGNTIQSVGYVPGLAGWRIIKNGTCEFRDIIARGDIEAQSLKANTIMVETAHVAGEAIIARRFGSGGVTTVSNGTSATVLVMPAITLPSSGISGLTISVGMTVAPVSVRCNVFVELLRDGVMIGERHAGAIEDMSLCVTATFFDASPGTSPVYSLRMRAGATPSGGGAGSYTVTVPTLLIDAAKR